jgi:hypothetical protein
MVSRVIRLGFFAFAPCSFLLAPGCSINPDTPEVLLRAAGSGIRSAPVV